MIRVLVVGFGPYPGVPANPSQEVVEALAAAHLAEPGLAIAPLVVPCAWWRGAEAVVTAARRLRPAAIVLIGHAPGEHRLIVAATAVNAASAGRDALGSAWPGPSLAPGGPARLRVTLPAKALRAAIEAAGVPAAVGADGGDFVWNRALWASISAMAAPMAGLICAPTPIESARARGACGPASLNRGQLMAGIEAALRQAGGAAAPTPAA